MVRNLGTSGWFGSALALVGWVLASVPFTAESATFTTPRAWISKIPLNGYPAAPNVQEPESQKTISEFLRSPKALVTPELAQLGLQTALERSREYLDRFAYEILKSLVRGLRESFPEKFLADPTASVEALALARLASLISDLIEPKLGTLQELSNHCTFLFDHLDKPSKKQLFPVFAGMMHMKDNESEDVIAGHSFWKKLRDSTCSFHGYVAESTRPEVWKFWLSHSILSSVLPSNTRSSSIQKLLARDSRIVENAGRLDTYLSFRGKPSGLSLKAAVDLRRDASDIRSTGKFAGSTAVSLLANYVSGWEEEVLNTLKLSKLWTGKPSVHPTQMGKDFSIETLFEVLPSNYPIRSPNTVLKNERLDPSAFEIGLVFWWKRIREPQKQPPYGTANLPYSRVLSAHWMAAALDGFSSHGAWNEALAVGNQAPTSNSDCCTRKMFGSTPSYAVLGYEYESALKTFEPALEVVRRSYDDKYWNDVRDNWLEGFVRLKNEALKMNNGAVQEVSTETAKWWSHIQFGTPISSIGLFRVPAKDPPESLPSFSNVQLARGNKGSIVPVVINAIEYELWVPATYFIVNYSSEPLSAQEWKELVQERGL